VSDRVAILHIGTHKTGTTSLQLFFEANKPRFAQAGVLVTQSGRYETLAGNHHIAWELLYGPQSEHLDELVAELRASPYRTALLSSEDFCLLYAYEASLVALRDAILSTGYTPKIVLYLRPQGPYAESMYVERVKHAYVRPLRTFLDAIFERGVYEVDDSPIRLEFRYTRLVAPFVRVFGRENVVVRPYVASAEQLTIFREFIGIIGMLDPLFAKTPLDLGIAVPRANESIEFGSLVTSAATALVGPAVDLAAEVRAHAPGLDEATWRSRYRLLTHGEMLRFADAFAQDNEALATTFGVRLPGGGRDDVAPVGDARWQQAAAQRATYDALIEAWTRRDTSRP
jgi:hypothetical protein